MVISPQDRGLTVRVAPGPFNDRFARVFGAALTPQAVTAVLAAADVGYLWMLADLLDEVRERDPHLHSVLAKREQQVAGAEYELRPPADSGATGAEIAKWATARLGEIESRSDLGRSFDDGLSDLMAAVYYGRAGLEATWRVEGRWWLPDELFFLHPRRFAYASDWRLHLWDQSGTAPDMYGLGGSSRFGEYPGVPFELFPAGKWIVHRPRIRGTYPTREGVGRTAMWYAIFKRFAMRDWLAFAEWAGRGLRVGKYAAGGDPNNPQRANDEDKQALEAALEAISSAVSTVVADTTELEIHDAPNTNDVHEKLLLACNNELSKAVLGETLTTEVGAAGGNRALGEVHNEVRLGLAKADAKALAATLRRDLLRPMVQRSFGERAPVPSIVFAVEPKEDRDALTERICKLVDRGLVVGQRDVRNLLALPDMQPDDEPLGARPAPDDDAPADGPGGSPGGGKRAPKGGGETRAPSDQGGAREPE